MTNFIFKSQGTYKKLIIKLEIIQSELRHQRVEHAKIIALLEKFCIDEKLQTQVDDYHAIRAEDNPDLADLD